MTSAGSVASRCGWLVAILAGLWLLSAWPAWVLHGGEGLESLSTSVVACLVPGCLVFVLAGFLSEPAQRGQVVLWGTALRIGFGLVAAFWLGSVREVPSDHYLVWLGLAYFVTLVFETALFSRTDSGVSASEAGGSPGGAAADSLR